MKKLTTNSKLIGCLMGLSIVALGTGCTDSDYDLSSVDSTIGVGGEGLELPTSSTENIILDDVLKLNNSDFVKIAANGDYMFNKDGDEATPSHPYINKIWVEKANVNNNFRLHITLPSQSAGARRAKLSNPVTAEGKLAEFHYTGAASNDIRELKEASVSSDVEISVAVSADLKRAVKTFKTLTLTVPSYMRLDLRQCSPSQPDYDAATGVVTFHNVSSTANIKLRAAVKTLDFQKPATTDNKLRFTPGQNGKDGQVDLNGVLNVGISFDEIDYAQSGGDLYLSANMSMGSITVLEATGKFDPEISLRDLGRTTIGSVPDFLTDGEVSVNLFNPLIDINIQSDIDVAGFVSGTLYAEDANGQEMAGYASPSSTSVRMAPPMSASASMLRVWMPPPTTRWWPFPNSPTSCVAFRRRYALPPRPVPMPPARARWSLARATPSSLPIPSWRRSPSTRARASSITTPSTDGLTTWRISTSWKAAPSN